ncbi:MAG: hypothetical protein Q7S36_01245 [Candidatus Liptonbacteria bacterium]|nr:hypothetical protein [Candidatus Liptonbacteria bacterium]
MKKYDWEKLEKIGEGGEKRVYKNPSNPESTLLRLKEQVRISEKKMKAGFYFSKILHLLFPKNIPDIHMAGTSHGENVADVEFKNLDEEHKALNKSASVFNKEGVKTNKIGAQFFDSGYGKAKQKLSAKLYADPQYEIFVQKMRELEVSVDAFVGNFGHDESGNLIYVDSNFRPWSVNNLDDQDSSVKPSPRYFYDRNKLLGAIDKLSETDKKKATTYLERVEELAEEDLRIAIKNKGKN